MIRSGGSSVGVGLGAVLGVGARFGARVGARFGGEGRDLLEEVHELRVGHR